MAFGATSSIFRACLTDIVAGTTAMDLNSDTLKAAVYGNAPTPDKNAASASTAYNAAEWVTANELTDGTGWPAGGVAIGSPTVTNPISGVIQFDGNNPTSAPTSVTIPDSYGVLVYDDTITTPVADQGVSFNSFGAVVPGATGVFTVVFDVNGIWRVTI